ncbi:FecR domain-containing protein [Pseudomonas sp. PDNC002]|uniref:FecR domain-containing protein n=1 Tax=Pseudomonas sp. PDNC002 TaxID=2811422 RepID=UPI00196365C4|nr:FecR domain-containing protein [Pseudomonas sp. PDNC002]QRY77237.1 FecR domain-containing protein [Pseudomonas sp. PDNC002]
MSERAGFDYATLELAAQWYARLQAAPGDLELRAQWRGWIDQGEAQRLAWSYVERIGQRFGDLQQQGKEAHQTLATLRTGKQTRRRLLSQFSVLAGAGVFGWLAWRHDALDGLYAWRAQYRTAIGERRSEQLSDGTRLWLNTGSALDVDFDASRRELVLYAGEVLIETGHGDSRPFQVRTRAGLLQPLGTRFSVREDGPRTQLNVYQGAVRTTCQDSGRSLVVQAGQAVIFDARDSDPLTPAEIRRESWSRGLLLAEDMPLSQFIEELGGYRRGHLGVDPAVANLRVMGSFSLANTDQALAQLEEALPVRVQRRFDWWVTVVPRS